MLHYRWPGNVRELRTAVEQAVVLCRGDKLTRGHFASPPSAICPMAPNFSPPFLTAP